MTNGERWVNCPYCGHKMFRWIDGKWVLEVKCPSCKKIFVLEGGEHNVQVRKSMCELPLKERGMQDMLSEMETV